MKKTVSISLGRAVLIACLLMTISAGGTSVAQWRYNLLDRAEAKIVHYLHSYETSVVSPPSATTVTTDQSSAPIQQLLIPTGEVLPTIPDLQDTALNVLAVQARLPTEEDTRINASEDQEYLASVLALIFPSDMGELSSEDISIQITRFVTLYLENKNNLGNATKILQEGYAICGGRVVVMRALMQRAGLPARIVNIFGLAQQGGHSLVEAYYENQWHLFDPTFGLFFYSEPEYNRSAPSGRIPSLSEILSSPNSLYLYQVVDRPWDSFDEQARSFGIARADDNYLSDYYGYQFTEMYRQYFYSAFPVEYDYSKQIISFPIVVDFSSDDIFSVGNVDNNQFDVLQATADPAQAGKVGTYYLISGGAQHYLHTWFITAPFAGYLRLTYYSAKAEPPVLMLFPLKAVYVVDAVQDGNKAEFLLRIIEPEAAIQFWASDHVYWVDAMQAEWLGVNIDSIEIP